MGLEYEQGSVCHYNVCTRHELTEVQYHEDECPMCQIQAEVERLREFCAFQLGSDWEGFEYRIWKADRQEGAE